MTAEEWPPGRILMRPTLMSVEFNVYFNGVVYCRACLGLVQGLFRVSFRVFI